MGILNLNLRAPPDISTAEDHPYALGVTCSSTICFYLFALLFQQFDELCQERIRHFLLNFISIRPHLLSSLFQYANGGSLVDLVSSEAILPWSCRINMALDIIRALCFLHQHGLIHRDLSPQVSLSLVFVSSRPSVFFEKVRA